MAMYYNTNTLRITTGVANEENVITSLRLAITEIEKILNRIVKCPFKVNIIRIRDKITKESKTAGYGYIWIGDIEVYWILAGHNPDGSERIEEYQDTNWLNIPESKSYDNDNNDDNLWADMMEKEISQQIPTIKKKLPPLVTLTGYKYSPEQLKELYESPNKFLPNNQNITDIGDMGSFIITRASVEGIVHGKLKNVLSSRFVPEWIPNEVFKSIFSRYISDPSVKIEIISNIQKTIDTVPVITRVGDTIFITYDPQTNDASFARIMQRKTRIQHPNDSEKKCEIIFDYAFENRNNKINVYRSNYNNILIGKKCLHNGHDYIIIDIKNDLVHIKNEKNCQSKWVKCINVNVI